MILRLLALACVFTGCSHTHDYELRARNVSTAPIGMEVVHVAPSGEETTAMLTEIAPGTSSFYLNQVRSPVDIAWCEAVFTREGAAGARIEIEHGVAADLEVDEQDGRVVVTDRRPD